MFPSNVAPARSKNGARATDQAEFAGDDRAPEVGELTGWHDTRRRPPLQQGRRQRGYGRLTPLPRPAVATHHVSHRLRRKSMAIAIKDVP